MKQYKFVANVRIRRQDKSGNTYHDITTTRLSDGALVMGLSVEKAYGYGTHYKTTMCLLLNKYELKNQDDGDWVYALDTIDNTVLFIVNYY
jgi:hypothetical protein